MSKYKKADFIKDEDKVIRIGNYYYKMVKKVLADGGVEETWSEVTRQIILDDYGKQQLYTMDKYDGFCNVPNHVKHQDVIHNNFNKYYPFQHKPKKGSVKWTMRLLRHIFGEQIDIGLDYIQLLYEKPTQILPILCLVSYVNQTGKTTSLNWVNELFKNNAVIIGNQDLQSPFNEHYGTKLVTMVDESKIDKNHVLEKIKAMATSKTININPKWVKQYTVSYFGKIIMCSNHEDNFITAKDEDIRYWVRKLDTPKFKNVNIEEDLKSELPAFVYYLNKRKMKHEKVSRMWFDPEELFTEALKEIKANSIETVIKHLMEYCTDQFDSSGEEVLFATPTDIKNLVFKSNSRIDPSYVRRLLKNKYWLRPATKIVRYAPLEAEIYDYEVKEMVKSTKTGRPFALKKGVFYLNGDVIEDAQKIKDVADVQSEDDLNLPF